MTQRGSGLGSAAASRVATTASVIMFIAYELVGEGLEVHRRPAQRACYDVNEARISRIGDRPPAPVVCSCTVRIQVSMETVAPVPSPGRGKSVGSRTDAFSG